MAKRMTLMLSVVAAFLAVLGFVKFQQFQAMAGQAAAFQPPPEAVTTAIALKDQWPVTLDVIGTTAPVQGVMVSADLPGIVERIHFESGREVREGEVLVQLDAKQERAQLAAAEAQRDLARLDFKRMQGLIVDGAISQADYDRAEAEQRQTEARAGEIRATIERKVIRAPFSGVLGIRQVHLGQYLAAGTAVVPLQSLDPIYVEFGIPQQDAGALRVGRAVHAHADNLPGVELPGRITAIDSVVDESTHNVKVQATLRNPGGRLRPGMFVRVQASAGESLPVVALPATAVSYAPYGDSVFVVAELKDQSGRSYRGVRQQFVKLGKSRGDQVAVISGLKPGEEVVTSGVFKLRNGAAVFVNNKVKPSNSAAPKPEDS